MASYGAALSPPLPPAFAQRVSLANYAAAALGVLSFVWGFLTWMTIGTGDGRVRYGGYAFALSGVGVIGFSIAAGLFALVTTVERTAMSLRPAALAATSLLLLIGTLIGKGNVGGPGASGPDVGVGLGLILALITVVVQLGVLVFSWITAAAPVPHAAAPAASSAAGAGYLVPSPEYPAPPVGYGPPPQYPPPPGGYAPRPAYPPPPAGYPSPAAGHQGPPETTTPGTDRPTDVAGPDR